jgi:hypothetical protein
VCEDVLAVRQERLVALSVYVQWLMKNMSKKHCHVKQNAVLLIRPEMLKVLVDVKLIPMKNIMVLVYNLVQKTLREEILLENVHV